MSTKRTNHIDVQPFDVLRGKGKDSFNHEGNIRFRHHVANATEAYNACQTASERAAVVTSVIDAVHCSGGRFLRKHQVHGNWIAMTSKEYKDKVVYAMRDAIVKWSKNRPSPDITQDGQDRKEVPIQRQTVSKQEENSSNDTEQSATEFSDACLSATIISVQSEHRIEAPLLQTIRATSNYELALSSSFNFLDEPYDENLEHET